MKKLLSVAAAVLLVLAMFVSALPASAEGYCYIVGNFESIQYGGDSYLPLDVEGVSLMGDYTYLECRFLDSSVEQNYHSFSVYQSEDAPYVLEVEFYGESRWSEYRVFVRESRYEAVKTALETGPASYITFTDYGEEQVLSVQEIEEWTSASFTDRSTDYMYLASYPLVQFYEGNLKKDYGLILRGYNDNGEEQYYLVLYSDYDTSAFYADGSLALDKNITLTLYSLQDEVFAKKLTALLDQLPDEELDWVVKSDFSDALFFVVTLLIFGLLPIGVVIAATVFILVKRPKNPFLVALIVLCIAAAVTVIAYSIILFILA